MNSKKYTVFLCALLASTFVHEALSKSAPVIRPKLLDEKLFQPEHISSISKRSTVAPGLSAAVANFGAAYSQFCVVNETANTASAFEPESNTCGFWNGNDQTAILIDLTTLKYVKISTGGWDATSVDFLEYIGAQVSILGLINVGVQISISAAVTADLNILAGIIKTLSIEIAAEIASDITICFSLVVSFSTQLLGLLAGELSGVLAFVSTTLVAITGDLDFVLKVLIGFAQICAAYTGGLAALILLGLEFNLSAVLAAANGVVALVIILTAFMVIIDLNLLASVLNNVRVCLSVIVLLGGEIIEGVNGVILVIARLVAALDAQIELSVALQVLIYYCCIAKINGISGIDVVGSVTLLVTLFSNNLTKYGSNASLTVIVAFVTQLVAGTLVYADVNLSSIITILIAAVITDALAIVTQVIVVISVVIDQVLCISTTLLSAYLLLNTTLGAIALNDALNIGLNVNTILGSQNILVTVVGNIAALILTLGGTVAIILSLPLSVILPQIATLNTIYSLLLTRVLTYTSKSLATCVNADNTANTRIKALIQAILTSS